MDNLRFPKYGTVPAEKLSRLKGMVDNWAHKKNCTKKKLLSSIGHLSHTRYNKTWKTIFEEAHTAAAIKNIIIT